MQPCSSREMQAMNSALLNQSQQISLQELQLQHSQIQHTHFDLSATTSSISHNDDFLEQILNTIPHSSSSSSWPHDMITPPPPPKSPWDDGQQQQQQLNPQSTDLSDETGPSSSHFNYGDDQSAFLASKLRQHQISAGVHDGVAAAKLLLQQQMMMARGVGGDCRMTQLPLSSMNGQSDYVNGSFKSPNQALYNSFAGSLHGAGQAPNQSQHFHHPQGGAMQAQSFNSPAGSTMNNQSQASGSTGGAPQQPRQRVRARRGQATDPHSIAERLRRERIAERMKALQELVPNANKTDKASMLDEIIDYVKFLQLQVKVLSMSRLGGAAAVAPLVADMSSEGGGDCAANTTTGNGNHVTAAAAASSSSNNDGSNSITMTEHQVAKLMEQDMGQAMQYLQGKGLCLMPISLATAISTATGRTSILNNNNNHHHHPLIQAPTSPSVSALTVQSATLVNGGANPDGSIKDAAASVSKP